MRGRGVKLLIHSPEEIRDRTRGFSVGSIVTAVDAALLCRYVGFLAHGALHGSGGLVRAKTGNSEASSVSTRGLRIKTLP